MIWDDSGFLISKNRYSENSLISEIYTKNHGKVSGIIFGGTSKKIKNYLQIGNHVYVNYNSKTENRIGYFKIEILQALSPYFFDNKQKLACIISAMNLIKLLTVESQENSNIFKLIDKFFMILPKKNWIEEYIFWELKLLKLIGYDLELKNMVNQEIINNEIKYFVKSKTEKKIVPNFLIDVDKEELNNINLLDGLNLVGDYLEKSILKPNNINYATERLDFINILK